MDEGVSLSRVADAAAAVSGLPRHRLNAHTAVDQDLNIVGADVSDFAQALADEHGEWVWSWPWQRFAQLDEGLSPLWPFALLWQLAFWPFRGRFTYPDCLEGLELGLIACIPAQGERIWR